jgi:hypothetical protein
LKPGVVLNTGFLRAVFRPASPHQRFPIRSTHPTWVFGAPAVTTSPPSSCKPSPNPLCKLVGVVGPLPVVGVFEPPRR